MVKMWNENTVNHFGQKLGRKANVIWSTDEPTTCNAIRELLFSTSSVLTGVNSGVTNVYKNNMEHVQLSRVNVDANGIPDSTKDYYWGIVYKGRKGWQAKYAINEPARMMKLAPSNHYDVNTDTYIWPVRMGYFITILSGQFFAGSKGNGDA